jgi:alpha-tubulin suppressor-like RCC1 family protein
MTQTRFDTKSQTQAAAALALALVAMLQTAASASPGVSVPPENVVLSFGHNGSGRNGVGTNLGFTPIASPIDATNFIGRNITQISSGELHSLILAEDGTVFSFGDNSHHQTGLGTDSGFTLAATPILPTNLGSATITQIAADWSQSLLLSEDGTVYSCGWNAYGATGQNTFSGDTTIASPINTANLGGRKIKQVAAGGDHALLLAEDGTVFSFGANEYGETGLGTLVGATSIATPIITTNLGGRKISQVAAGPDHCLLLAEDGTVFSFGENEYGQTGLNTTSGNTLIATPINTSQMGGKKITSVAAGNVHSLLLAEDGTVFAFGWNIEGRTGQGTQSGVASVATPILTTNIGGRKIEQIDAKGALSLLLADDGTVFSFGSNFAGQTGLGLTTGATLVATPIDTTNLAGLRVTKISAGVAYGLLLATPIPEPAAIWLFIVGVSSVLAARRRRHV